jgi:hypothetical protein
MAPVQTDLQRYLRRRLPNHPSSANLIPDEEDLWVDREHHLTLLAGAVSLRGLQRPLDALSLHRHLEPSGAPLNVYGDLYHSLLLSYRLYRTYKKKYVARCEASASAGWPFFVGHVAYFRVLPSFR